LYVQLLYRVDKTYFNTILKLITSGHRITDLVNRAMIDDGLTEPQYNVLRILHQAGNEPLTVQEVQNGMVQQSSNVTRIVDKLLVKGLVNRSECPTNRRKLDLTLTDKGKELLKTLDQKVLEIHRPMMSKLTEEEFHQLGSLIDKLNVS
jgi:MarR family transcriptional regulator, 2-MHQ and catechol-resistance regulon repressor